MPAVQSRLDMFASKVTGNRDKGLQIVRQEGDLGYGWVSHMEAQGFTQRPKVPMPMWFQAAGIDCFGRSLLEWQAPTAPAPLFTKME